MHTMTKGGVSNGDPEVMNIFHLAKQPDGSYKVQRSKEYLDTAKFAVFSEAVRKELPECLITVLCKYDDVICSVDSFEK